MYGTANTNVPTDPTRFKAFPLDLDKRPPNLKKVRTLYIWGQQLIKVRTLNIPNILPNVPNRLKFVH